MVLIKISPGAPRNRSGRIRSRGIRPAMRRFVFTVLFVPVALLAESAIGFDHIETMGWKRMTTPIAAFVLFNVLGYVEGRLAEHAEASK